MFKSFLTMPMHSISYNHGSPKPGILLNTLWASSRLPHLPYMSTKLFPTKSYQIHKHFEGFIREHTCPCQVHLDSHMHGQHLYKRNRVWMHTFLLHLLKLFQCRLPLKAIHISQYHGSSIHHISRWMLLLNALWASSMLPHWVYMSTKLLPTNTSESHPLPTTSSWVHMPSSSVQLHWHMYSQPPTKVTMAGHTQSCCNLLKWIQCLCVLAHISHVHISLHSKWPHLETVSC
jgi:hypothetical protein